MGRQAPGRRAGPRSARTKGRSGRETQSSRQRRLARKKAAAEGSRREHKRQAGGRNSKRPWDFEAHGPQRATAKFPMVERRTSVNRSPCGRRTSLMAGQAQRPPCRQYTRSGREIPCDLPQQRKGNAAIQAAFTSEKPFGANPAHSLCCWASRKASAPRGAGNRSLSAFRLPAIHTIHLPGHPSELRASARNLASQGCCSIPMRATPRGPHSCLSWSKASFFVGSRGRLQLDHPGYSGAADNGSKGRYRTRQPG